MLFAVQDADQVASDPDADVDILEVVHEEAALLVMEPEVVGDHAEAQPIDKIAQRPSSDADEADLAEQRKVMAVGDPVIEEHP